MRVETGTRSTENSLVTLFKMAHLPFDSLELEVGQRHPCIQRKCHGGLAGIATRLILSRGWKEEARCPTAGDCLRRPLSVGNDAAAAKTGKDPEGAL